MILQLFSSYFLQKTEQSFQLDVTKLKKYENDALIKEIWQKNNKSILGIMDRCYEFLTEFNILTMLSAIGLDSVYINFQRSLSFGCFNNVFILYSQEVDELLQAVKKLKNYVKCFY